MARLKRTSAVLDVARRRLAGLKSIGGKDVLGATLTEAIYQGKVDSVSGREEGYNQLLSQVDQELNGLQAEEADLNEFNGRILAAGAARFGPDSTEYEMLGGTRKSERKKPTKKGGGTDGGSPSPKP